MKPAVPLSGTLSEFRDALNAEVEAGKRASAAGSIPLANGRRLGTLGTGFQYQFDVESALDLPGDAPGELRIPGMDPIRVAVIAFEGLTVTLNTELDLGPHVGVAILQSDLSMLLLKLIERIEKKSTLANPAGDRLLGVMSPSGDAEPITNTQLEAHGISLNREQLKAVGSVLGRDTTYIWGPPGTGKTHTIGAIGAELFRRGQSLLVVSHTNTAVDGAILAIGESVRQTAAEDIERGLVVRVGTPKDESLKSATNASLLLSVQRERRQAELAAKKVSLIAEREPLLIRERQLSLIIELHEWLDAAEPDLIRLNGEMERLRDLRRASLELGDRERALEPKVREYRVSHKTVLAALQAAESIEGSESRIAACKTERDSCKERRDHSNQRIAILQVEVARARELEPSRVEYSQLPALATAKDTVDQLRKKEESAEAALRKSESSLKEAERLLVDTEAVNWITRKWKGLPDPDAQKAVVAEAQQRAASAREAHNLALGNRQRAQDTVRSIERLSALLAPHAALPGLAEMERRLSTEQREGERRTQLYSAALTALALAESERTTAQRVLAEFRSTHRCEPRDAATQGKALEDKLDQVQASRRSALQSERALSDSLTTELRRGVQLLRDLGLSRDNSDTPEELYNSLSKGIEHARVRASAITRTNATSERATIISRVKAIATELDQIEDSLRRIEDVVIREARIVGATLTASYLREAIQTRRFDTVLLDEASMAAIPALWLAASLADRALVVVGDYRQLPPVVVSQAEIALKWLGRDPFEIVELTYDGPKPDHFVGLREQRRMHPAVSAIANELIYAGVLQDHEQTLSREDTQLEWLSSDWPHRDPVLLVDTGRLNAWVTPVSRGGGNSSRLNFMSATVCADIASRMLSPDRMQWDATHDPRILIISPYRPHSRLVSLLLKDDGLGHEVLSGTVHTFQGSQADVVILDLVNDEPHWKVGHFMALTDASTARLFNVAVTRAKRRLVVVGDFDYCEKLGRKAFLGGRFIPLLRKSHPVVNAVDVVPEGIATRAAAANRRLFGGDIKVEHERTVIRQDKFYTMLSADLAAATQRVVIYSPFITQKRLGELEAPLKAAVERGVSLVVVTKPVEEREKGERSGYRSLEKALAAWQVGIVHKRGMHEKLVLIDTHTVWTGSLNPLSFRDTQEVMERRYSTDVFDEYAKTLMLQELLDEYSHGRPTCPICGGEVSAAEGGSTPFYWRCVDRDCLFKRGIDDDSLKDGAVRCHCGGEVKLVDKDKDGRARWICTENARHKQIVKAMHLRLVKVRERYSASRLERLERRFAAEAKKKGHKKSDDSLFA